MRIAEDTFSRVMRSVDTSGRCFLWRGRTNDHGYGRIETPEGERYVHRIVYEWTWGPLVHGQVVMHSCDTPACCNPAHLTAGTQGDNARDMWKKGRGKPRCAHAGKTHCIRGHEFTTANTRINGRTGYRYCRTCHRERNRKQRAA